MTLTRDRAAAMRETYPSWELRQSESGRWWAYRLERLTREQRQDGYRLTLDADTLDELGVLLGQQTPGDKARPRTR